MKKIENGCQDKLDWFDGKHINEILFCQEFLKTHPMRCIGGTLFTVDGPVESEELVKRQIIDMVQSCVTTNLSKRDSSLLESLKIQAYSEPLPVELDRIHCANGIYFLDGHFEPKKVFCNNRLSVRYNLAAPKPLRWLQFLSELLEEDIDSNRLFLYVVNGQIEAVFAFILGADPTYAAIEDGQWLDDTLPYGTVHRLASAGKHKGVASAVLDWSMEHCQSLRADTHADNKIMQHLLEKNGFTRCGVIHVADGSPRFAYQKLAPTQPLG